MPLRSSFGEDVAVLALDIHTDERGTLSAVDLDSLPFRVRRLFRVSGVPAGTCRGGHGHVRGSKRCSARAAPSRWSSAAAVRSSR